MNVVAPDERRSLPRSPGARECERRGEGLLAAALDYARRGWRVFPCAPRSKIPIARRGCLDATTDEQQIGRWWHATPDANIGVATGRASGIVVLDVDAADTKRGDVALVELVAQQGAIGDPLHVITGSAGDHYYFAHPGARIGNTVGRLGPGLDTRDDGGYVIAPPSVHPNGNAYAWCRLGALVPMPAWMIRLLEQRETVLECAPAPRTHPWRRSEHDERCFRASQYLARMPHAISGSGGHEATMRAAVALACGFELPPADALDLVIEEYNPRCEPPWSRRELEHKVASAIRARVGRGYLLRRRSA